MLATDSLTGPVALKHACSRCTGVQSRSLVGAAPTCPNGYGMVPVPDPSPVTGCLHVVGNFRQLPARTKQHFVPRTGRGKFDCSYTPNDGRLEITVRLHLATGTTWFGRGFSSSDLERIRNDFSASIPRLWNGKWAFLCTKPGFGGLPHVTPRFRIAFDSPEGAHFKLIIALPDEASAQNTSPEMRNCRGFVSLNQVVSNNPAVQDRVELLDFHVQDFQHSIAPQMIAQYERQRLEGLLSAVGVAAPEAKAAWVFLAFDALGGTPLARLNTFAAEAMRRVRGSQKVPVIVQGVTAGAEAAQVGRLRADAVKTALGLAGLDNPVTVLDSVDGGAAGVRMRIDTAFEDAAPPMAYNVAAHEFGHMLGLPDEYENPTAGGTAENNAKAIVKTNYLALVGAARERPPTFPSHTMSMMSDGMTIQPFHTVTIWDALCFLTRGIIDPAEWDILML